MSLATVKARLAAIIEGARPASRPRGLAGSFRRVATDDDPLDGRRFFFRLDTLSVVGPHLEIDGGFTRTVDSLAVVVCYPEDLAGDEVDDHIHADFVTITRALLDQSGWKPEASGLVNVSAAEGVRLLSSTIEREPGIIRLVVPLTVEHML